MQVSREWGVALRAALIVGVAWVVVPSLVAYVWDTGATSSFEESPQDTANVAGGALKIRETRNETRRRAAVEHSWGTASGGTDSGRHLKGSARAFFQASAPTVMPNVDTSGGSSSVLDDGRLWVDSDNNTLYVNTNAAGAAFAAVSAMPANAIILWDQATGDVNCDGAPGAGECPCGYTEATEFRNLAIRGADIAVGTVVIPDVPGVTCDNIYGGLVGTGCSATHATSYADIQTADTLFTHSHSETYSPTASGGGGGSYNVNNADHASGNAGASEPWPGPFRTVLFCRKT